MPVSLAAMNSEQPLQCISGPAGSGVLASLENLWLFECSLGAIVLSCLWRHSKAREEIGLGSSWLDMGEECLGVVSWGRVGLPGLELQRCSHMLWFSKAFQACDSSWVASCHCCSASVRSITGLSAGCTCWSMFCVWWNSYCAWSRGKMSCWILLGRSIAGRSFS